jgi:hypothetical protein
MNMVKQMCRKKRLVNWDMFFVFVRHYEAFLIDSNNVHHKLIYNMKRSIYTRELPSAAILQK